MSLRNVIGGAGAVVGFIYGGAQGAQWGWMIGSTVGGVVDPQIIHGPKLGEIPAQQSQEGGPRPIVLGRSAPIAGCVIAEAPPVIDTQTSSGKGGPKYKTEVVYRTYAIGICEGPIGGIERVWRNGKKVYDIADEEFTAAADISVTEHVARFVLNSSTTPSRNELFLEKARFFLGTYDQSASPDLEAVFGAGTTAAHRGTAYMVIVDEDTTDIGGAIPQWTFQVGGNNAPAQIIYTADDVWEKPAGLISITVTAIGAGGGGGSGRRGYTNGTNGGGGGGGGGKSSATILAADLAATETVTVGQGGAGAPGTTVATSFTEDGTKGTDGGDSSFGSHVTAGGGLGGAGGNQGSTAPSLSAPARGFGGSGTDADGGDGGYSTGVTGTYFDGNPSTGGGGGGGAGGGRTVQFADNIPSTDGGNGDTADEDNAGGSAGGRAVAGGNGTSSSAYHGGGGGAGGGGNTWISDPVTSGPAGAPGGGGGNRGGGGGGGGCGQSQNNAGSGGFSLIQSGAGGDGGDGVVIVDQVVEATVGMTLREMVSTIVERAGIPSTRYSVSALPDVTVPGLTIINTYQAVQALQALEEIYLFDHVYFDSVLYFVPRGGDSVATITEDDMVDEDAEIEEHVSESARADALGIPRLLHLDYHDADSTSLDSGKQTSERWGDRRAVGESTMQTPVLADATTIARAVDVAHKTLIERVKGSLRFSLPEKWAYLIPTNPIIVQWKGRSERAVIGTLKQCDGYQTYECQRDRQSAYTSVVEAIPLPEAESVPSTVPGPTVIVPLDIQLVRDTDDSLGVGLYIAVAGLLEGWPGASVELSYDGGANYIDAETVVPGSAATIGYLKSALGNHPAGYPDVTNTCKVRIASYGKSLSGTTLAGMLNRTNLAAIGSLSTGWEIVNFADVEATTDDDLQISYLLRGRKGSTARHHTADEFFVLLERANVVFVPLQLADLGRTLTFRATSFGTASSTGTVVSIDLACLAQTEQAPANVQAHRSGSDAVVSWLGVGRLGGGGVVAQGQNFTGYRVSFTDGVTTITQDTTAETITQDVSSLAGTITIAVSQLNSLTGAGPSTEVSLP